MMLLSKKALERVLRHYWLSVWRMPRLLDRVARDHWYPLTDNLLSRRYRWSTMYIWTSWSIVLKLCCKRLEILQLVRFDKLSVFNFIEIVGLEMKFMFCLIATLTRSVVALPVIYQQPALIQSSTHCFYSKVSSSLSLLASDQLPFQFPLPDR